MASSRPDWSARSCARSIAKIEIIKPHERTEIPCARQFPEFPPPGFRPLPRTMGRAFRPAQCRSIIHA